jgi:ribosome-binding factor A
MPTRRQQRISELLLEELSLLVSAELTDPRLEDAMLIVTRVDVSPDLRSARVFVEHSLGQGESHLILRVLGHSAGFLRRALAEHLDLRVVPELSFHLDYAAERGRRVDRLLDEITSETGSAGDDEQDDTD